MAVGAGSPSHTLLAVRRRKVRYPPGEHGRSQRPGCARGGYRMDRTELSGVIIQDLGAIFTEALAAAAPTVLTADLDGVERCVQAISRQVMGRVVEQVIAARGGPPAGP